MSLPVLTAVTGTWEAPLVAGLERSGGDVQVVRRCADLAELMSAAGAGLAQAVLVSGDLHRLDRESVAQLARAGVAVVGLADPAGADAAQHLRGLGVVHVVPADAPADVVAAAVAEAVAQVAAHDGAGGGADGGADGGAGPTGRGGGRRGHGDPHDPAEPLDGVDPTGSRLVAVWGPVGAPGRTTVAVTLAAELSAVDGPVLLVDADTYGATVAQVLGLLDESAGLAAAVRAANHGTLEAARLARLAPVVMPGLRVLTGLPRPSRWPELRASGLDVVWQTARRLARWVVVDCGFCLESDEELSYDTSAPRRNQATLSALAAADLVVSVGASDPVGLQRLVRGLQDLAEVSPAAPRVVVNRLRASAVGPSPRERVTEALERFAGVRPAMLVPEDREACDAALLAGRSLTEHARSSPARLALAALAGDLAGVAQPVVGRRRPRA